MLTTMKTYCPWKVHTQSICPAFCTLAALSKKRESVYTLDESNSSIFVLKKIMMNLASFFPQSTVICAITDRYHRWQLVTTHDQHINQRYFLNGSITQPRKTKHCSLGHDGFLVCIVDGLEINVKQFTKNLKNCISWSYLQFFSVQYFEITSHIFCLFQQFLKSSGLNHPVRNIFAVNKSAMAISKMALLV